MCVPVCPLGWKDEGKRCFKPGTFHNGNPFNWTYGDSPLATEDANNGTNKFQNIFDYDQGNGTTNDQADNYNNYN